MIICYSGPRTLIQRGIGIQISRAEQKSESTAYKLLVLQIKKITPPKISTAARHRQVSFTNKMQRMDQSISNSPLNPNTTAPHFYVMIMMFLCLKTCSGFPKQNKIQTPQWGQSTQDLAPGSCLTSVRSPAIRVSRPLHLLYPPSGTSLP